MYFDHAQRSISHETAKDKRSYRHDSPHNDDTEKASPAIKRRRRRALRANIGRRRLLVFWRHHAYSGNGRRAMYARMGKKSHARRAPARHYLAFRLSARCCATRRHGAAESTKAKMTSSLATSTPRTSLLRRARHASNRLRDQRSR